MKQPFMKLVIGGVGSGKTSFIKRYFNYIMSGDLKSKTIYCRINFNNASEDLEDIRAWVCNTFIDIIRENFSHIIDPSSEEGLKSIFSKEIRDRKGAYDLLKKASLIRYNERLAEDMLQWMSEPETFAGRWRAQFPEIVEPHLSLFLITLIDGIVRRN